MTTTDSSPQGPGAALATAVAELKPRLRGWLHAYAAAVSIVSGAILTAVAFALRGGVAGLTTAIYSATVTLLFGTSALYHRRTWSPRAHVLMKRLDHSMIFVFIAGTYTPIAVLTLPTGAMIGVLVAVWSGALVGVGLQTLWPAHPRWISAPCYIALGWVAVFVFPDLLHNAGVAAFVLIAAGGIIYTIGGVVYALKRPNPYPGVFGFHEVFHLCTLVAAICHYIAIWFAVFSS
ncbi:MAG: hemolysin [Pseudonocardiales bacterium]|nr:Hemolysin [Jatrophihabitans sp.]MDT4900531.1 hemolysin [Pseudonocardiales bacterium]MDT4902753.1 hemolysin [Pseudonocardiales bacterium]MDT4930467.1 hemolysin [Pseudonocardiales bacterium]